MEGMRSRRIGGFAVLVAAAVFIAIAALGVISADAGKKKSDKGYLGVYMQELDSDVKEGLDLKVDRGVLISGVADDSPAAKAGIEDGDVIVMFDGKEVSSTDALRDLVSATEPGSAVEIKLIRDGKNKTIKVEVGERPGDFFFSWDDHGDWPGRVEIARFIGGPALGVHATELNEGLAEYFDTSAESGVLVLEVNDETVAEKAGVEAGDVIQKIDDEAVSSVDELRETLRDFEEGDEFGITVLRHGKKQTLKATMDDQRTLRAWKGHMSRFRMHNKTFRAPRIHMERFGDDLREDLDEMRRELDELKKELKEKS